MARSRRPDEEIEEALIVMGASYAEAAKCKEGEDIGPQIGGLIDALLWTLGYNTAFGIMTKGLAKKITPDDMDIGAKAVVHIKKHASATMYSELLKEKSDED